VTDPDLAGQQGRGISGEIIGAVEGVVAGGPGAIAWGGSRIWTSPNGRDWTPATVEDPPDLTKGGGIADVAVGGPGLVAVGGRWRSSEGQGLEAGALIWTSVDGRSWQRVATGPAFTNSSISQVVPWNDGLLAFGSGPIEGNPPDSVGWTSNNGVTWTRFMPELPTGVFPVLGVITPWRDTLLADGWTGFTTIDDPGWQQPPRLESPDGRTWTHSALPIIGYDGLHPLPDGLYLIENIVAWKTSPAWVTRKPGTYRSTDLRTWIPLAVGKPLGAEVVASGGALWMVGEGAWRSTDGGRVWDAVPVIGQTPAGVKESTMVSAAVLADGTIVAIGVDKLGGEGLQTAAWYLQP
jgi:hypothetical protein